MSGALIAVISIVIAIYIYCICISLIKKSNKVVEAFSSVDIQLKKRYDLIPNILKITNKFMEHERTLFEEITALRAQIL